jgi:hypothetical protein
MMPGIRRGLLLILLLALLVVTLLGCNNAEYRTFTFEKGVNLTFEYPSHYRRDLIYSYVEGKSAGRITFLDRLSSKVSIYGFIWVTIRDPSGVYPYAKTAIEQIASGEYDIYTSGPGELNRDILERSTIIINGIPAELIVYSHKVGFIERLPYESSKIIRINRTVYFDHNGLLWSIAIESDEDKAEQARADFEHLLQTFKILE